MGGFSEEKANSIIDHVERLFPDDPDNAALHCAVVLLGLCVDNHAARRALEFVISQHESIEYASRRVH